MNKRKYYVHEWTRWHITPSACNGWALHKDHQRVQPLLWSVLHVQIVFVHWFANQMPSYPKYKHTLTHKHTHVYKHTQKNTHMRAQNGCGMGVFKAGVCSGAVDLLTRRREYCVGQSITCWDSAAVSHHVVRVVFIMEYWHGVVMCCGHRFLPHHWTSGTATYCINEFIYFVISLHKKVFCKKIGSTICKKRWSYYIWFIIANVFLSFSS